MLRHIEVQQLATVVFEDDEYEQHLHGDGRHGKEIGRDDLADMVVQEGLPRLVRWAAEPAVSDPKYPIQGRQQRTFPFALKRG
jgi:hypothetical protein